jgi:UMP-CMP kinase family protein
MGCIASRNTTKPDTPLVVFVLGGPGAGKGTQCGNIVRDYGFVHLSAGDLLRAERKSGSANAELINKHIAEGSIVPVEITCSLIKNAMQTAMDEDGRMFFLVDGFPRNQDNLDGWNATMSDFCEVAFVLFFDVSEEVMENRLLIRGKDGDRIDDNLETIRRRFQTFKNSTMPIVNHFAAQDKVRTVDGDADRESVYAQVSDIFEKEMDQRNLRSESEKHRFETTFAFIKPDVCEAKKDEEMLEAIKAAGFEVVAQRKDTLSKAAAEKFYEEHKERPFFGELVDFMTSGPSVALALRKRNAIADWRTTIGPTKSDDWASEPECLRAKYGTDTGKNAAHGSDSPVSAQRELGILFPGRFFVESDSEAQTTFAFIKPDVVEAKKDEEMLDAIKAAGFEVVAQRKATVTKAAAEKFYEEHKERPFYGELVDFMTSGPSVALALRKRNAIAAWRQAIGPTKSDDWVSAPYCLRATYGTDTGKNAAHGSDSTDSAERELSLLFPGRFCYGKNATTQTTFAFIKPDVVEAKNDEEMLEAIKEAGFQIVAQRKATVTKAAAEKFYEEHKERPFYGELVDFMTSGPSVALALRKRNAIAAWRQAIGPTKAEECRANAPYSLRTKYGTDTGKNAAHGSDSTDSAERELSLLFPGRFCEDSKSTVQTTFAFIKPDVVEAGKDEEMLEAIKEAGFEVVAQRKDTLPKAAAEKFYEEHKERPFFGELVDFMTSGPSVALALRKTNAIAAWRQAIGPTKAEECRANAPYSLRAKYGTDTGKNAAHGSDSTDSAARELSILFPGRFCEDSKSTVQTTFAFIKPDVVEAGKDEEMLEAIKEAGFEVVAQRKDTLPKAAAEKFYEEHKERPFFGELVDFMTSGPSVALALRKTNAIAAWRQAIGPTKAEECRANAPYSLRAKYGTDTGKNAAHGSDSTDSAARELSILFPGRFCYDADSTMQTTFAFIKPDVCEAKNDEEMLEAIKEIGFEIVAQRKEVLPKATAEKFYEEHKDRPFFGELVDFMTSGPSVALALRKTNAIAAWRQAIGPTKAEECRANAPYSLRAKYGTDTGKNAAHGSDSVASATRELGILFPAEEL